MSKKPTLKEQQIQLDVEKWTLSETTHCDQSGNMRYCQGCSHRVQDVNRIISHCDATQDARTSYSLCARNLRKIKKADKADKADKAVKECE